MSVSSSLLCSAARLSSTGTPVRAWTNMELEKSVRMMERNVMAMEAGNHETDDSDAKQKYEG